LTAKKFHGRQVIVAISSTLTSWETLRREEDMPHWVLDEVMLVIIALKANARCWLAKSTLERLLQVIDVLYQRKRESPSFLSIKFSAQFVLEEM